MFDIACTAYTTHIHMTMYDTYVAMYDSIISSSLSRTNLVMASTCRIQQSLWRKYHKGRRTQ